MVPTGVQNIVEMGVEFIRDIAVDNIGEAGKKYVPFLVALFFFVLFGNLVGLIPGVFTITAQVFVTAVLAVIVYVMSLVVGFRKHGAKFFSILVPGGTPGWLVPLMIPIEILSQLARPVSLAVRLFANMTAGHTILAVMFGMTISLPIVVNMIPFAFTVLIYALELFIAFIQAYIFVMLSCVYLGDAENLAH
jgi:F-type H+-transporting ATPase subunit a